MLPLGSPFTRTEYEVDLMHAMIKDIHFSQKPIISIVLCRKSHSTLSKALLISSLRVIKLVIIIIFILIFHVVQSFKSY